MTWQLPLVLLIVAAASAYLARRAWRTWFGAKTRGCGGGCGCANAAGSPNPNAPAPLIPVDQLVLRRRDADRP
jgi:FeoB-associated Cys-rich membrane protein